MMYGLEKIWKVMDESRHYPGIFVEGLWKTLRKAHVLAEDRTEHSPNTSQERYPYANLLGR
jgi:hypothetical protein